MSAEEAVALTHKEQERPSRKVALPSEGCPTTLEDCLRDPGATVERAIWAAVNSDPKMVLVTGPAGTGKSVLLQLIAAALPNPVILAPTGIAALGVGGQTIHSFFRLAPGVQKPEDDTRRPEQLYRSISTLICDEISMVRADLLDKISSILCRARCSSLPFGGVRVIGFGDLLQLPPIVEKKEDIQLQELGYQGRYFFDARVAENCPPACFTLTRVHRQRERMFIEVLNAVRVGNVSSRHLARINTRVFPESVARGAGSLTLTAKCLQAEVRNEQRLLELPSPEQTYHGRIEGAFSTKQLPVPKALTLRPGARILFVRNDEHGRWVNGLLGTILECNLESILVERDGGLGPCTVFPAIWTRHKHTLDQRTGLICREVVGRYIQLPVVLGWAATIHKAQGATLDRCHIDLGTRVWAPGQTYVALSRCRTLGGLTLQHPVTRKHLITDPRVVEKFGPSTGEKAA